MMSIDKEQAQSLATHYLSEQGLKGLVFCGARFAPAGDELSLQPERDIWNVLFERPPPQPGAPIITGGLVVVMIDDRTLEISLFRH